MGHLGRQPPQRLDGHGAADAVVHALGRQVVTLRGKRPLEVRRIAHAYRTVVAPRRSHVDKVLVQWVNGRAVVIAVSADDAQRAVGEAYPPAHQRVWPNAADVGEAQEPLLRDVGGHYADLVHVSGHHHLEWVFAGGALIDDEVTHRVDRHLIGVRLHQRADQVAHAIFKARRAKGFHERANQVIHGVSHHYLWRKRPQITQITQIQFCKSVDVSSISGARCRSSNRAGRHWPGARRFRSRRG